MANPVDIVPSLGHGLLTTQAGFGLGFDAIDDRRFWSGFERGEGVATYESFRVRQRGAGANMSVDVGMDEGAYVRGDSVAQQGLYYVAPHPSTINVDIAAADASNPRLDLVVLEAKDDTHDAGGLNKARVRTVAGTPTAGATLDNRNGAAALPNGAILLADVIVATSDTSIIDAEIRDRRPFNAGVPPLLTDVDMAPLIPVNGVSGPVYTDAWNTTNHDLMQSALLVYLPRRIVNATRIRWKYRQQATAMTGNYVLGLYDASGRKIVDTGAVALAGTAGTLQTRAEVIASTTFEPGLYYLFAGLDITNSSAAIDMLAFSLRTQIPANVTSGVGLPNVALRSATGGTTPPTTLLGFTDAYTLGATTVESLALPLCALSVG